MTEFYHPYQFVPTTGKINGKSSATVSYQAIVEGASGLIARHDLWQSEALSGRLTCSVTLKTPTFIGQNCQQDASENHPAVVEGYKRLVNGKEVYIPPGSSLRGMVGAVAESLSQSALRVLEDKRLSVRKDVGQSLPALGRAIRCQKKEGYSEYAIQPMTFATQWEFNRQNQDFQLPSKWVRWFKGRSLQKVLPVYLDGYRKTGSKGKEVLEYTPDSFLGRNQPDALPAIDKLDTSDFYYARLYSELTTFSADEHIPSGTDGLYIKETKGGRQFLIGQSLMPVTDALLSSSDFQRLPSAEQAQYTKGILRVLDVLAHSGQIPLTKKHELFLPWPDDLEVNGLPTRIFLMQDQVESTYNFLVKESDNRDESMPVLLKGHDSATSKQNRLFYFDVSDEGIINEISLSSIWRKALPDSIHQFYTPISPDLLPWHQGRSHLTPVEALWGVVQSDKEADAAVSRNLASRLRFSDALPATDITADQQLDGQQAVTLKILSGPKLPSPAMYFHGKQPRTLIKKQDLTAGQHTPNGRKVFLHHPELVAGDTPQQPWKTTNEEEHLKQKTRVHPLKPGQTFHFHIDFENLSPAELGLLYASLHPGEGYLHRLGMAKAFGLGSVELTIDSLNFIDRCQRYQVDGLDVPRYSQRWVREPVEGELPLCDYSWDKTLIDVSSRKNVLASGDVNQLKKNIPVQYPTEQDQKPETEGFAWFVNNAPSQRSDPPGVALGAIDEGKVPTLNSNQKQPAGHQNNSGHNGKLHFGRGR